MHPSLRRVTAAAFCAIALLSCRSTSRNLAPAIATEDDPDARDRWYWQQRVYPTGSIPSDVHRAAVERELQAIHAFSDETQWSNLGPSPLRHESYGFATQDTSGRALAVAIDPRDANTIFVGTAQGGIWKSTDGGASFHSLAETTLPSLAINVIKFRPGDPTVIYAGTGEPNASTSVYGFGLLRSTDGGATWQQLPSHGDGWNFDHASITGLLFDPRNRDTMFVSTATIPAAPNIFTPPPGAPTSGIFRSTDGGQTWTLLRAARRYKVNGGLASTVGILDLESGGPTAPDLLYASENYGGLLRSDDAGASWVEITPHKSGGVGDFPAPVDRIALFDSATLGTKSVARLPNDISTPEFRRIEIGVSAANPNVLYAGYGALTNRLDVNGNGVYDDGTDVTIPLGLLFKSEDRGATWRWLGSLDKGIPNYCATQCGYDNVVSVNPDDPNDVMLGGNFDGSAGLDASRTRLVDLPWHGMVYRSFDGGKSWTDTTPQCTAIATASSQSIYPCSSASAAKVIHPDVHGIVFGPAGTLYVVTDGGLFRGTLTAPTSGPSARRRASGGGLPFPGLRYTWESLNNSLATLQFYRITSHPTDPNILLGGMQDNSSGRWNGSDWEAWGGGDGTIAAFDPSDPQRIYLGAQFVIFRNDHGGPASFDSPAWKLIIKQKQVTGETTSFVPVFALDPVEPSILYSATDKGLLRSTDRGAHVTRVLPATVTDGTPTSVSVSPVDHNVVWLGTSTGFVYRYQFDATGGATRTDVTGTGTLPKRAVSRVAAATDSASSVFAVFNGYDANTPSIPGKVFVSTDGGSSWRNISGSLPDVPAIAIALDPHDAKHLWLGTDIAVYSTNDLGTTWTSERRNMPIVGVQDLDYNANTGFLHAATHGRGIWRLAVH